MNLRAAIRALVSRFWRPKHVIEVAPPLAHNPTGMARPMLNATMDCDLRRIPASDIPTTRPPEPAPGHAADYRGAGSSTLERTPAGGAAPRIPKALA